MEKMKKRKAIGAFVKGAAYSLTALLAFSCGNSQQGGMPALSLAVMTVEPTSQELNSAYPATIKGQQDIEIRARVSGYITKLCVDEGAVVHKGQPLFLIDAVPYQKAVQAAEAAVEVAKANVATTQLTVDSKTELHAQNIISDYDLQTAKNSLASAKAALAQAEAQLASARNDLSYTTITSPSDGVVGTIPFRVGSLVGTTTQEPLTVVSDINKTISADYGVLAGDEEIDEDGNVEVNGELIAYRGLFLIDKDGIVRHQLINDFPLGRSIDEAIRVVDALQHFELYGEVCPLGWHKGDAAMTPSHEGVASYLSK